MADLMVPIQFVNDDPTLAVTTAIADYEAIAGRTLGQADPERLAISAFALRLAQVYSQMNATANQNLLQFASGVALEQLGFKFGVFRLPAAAAQVTIQFTISGTSGSVFFPAGTRVKSNDGAVLFATNANTTFVGSGTVNIDCTCLTVGLTGNNYAPGMVTIIVDPIAFVSGATNIDTTTGGSNEETDDELRIRIPLANSTFSVAGPTDAYIFFAKTADPAIVDVNIPDPTPVPGTVYIYPLLAGGVIPGVAILDAVQAICSDKKVRPLTDTVIALAPTQVNYNLVINLTLKSNAPAGTDTLVAANVNGFVNQFDSGVGRLGVDVVVDQIIGMCMLTGVYSVAIPSLLADIPIADNEFAYCTGVTVNVVAIVPEL